MSRLSSKGVTVPTLPGLNADVFFGGPDEPLPDWRQDRVAEEDEEESVQPGVAGMLGFDPDELEREDRSRDNEAAATFAADPTADPEDGERHRLEVPDRPLNDAPPAAAAGGDGADLLGLLSEAFARRGYAVAGDWWLVNDAPAATNH